MELKVWVEGIQRIVCGVTEKTTCQVGTRPDPTVMLHCHETMLHYTLMLQLHLHVTLLLCIIMLHCHVDEAL